MTVLPPSFKGYTWKFDLNILVDFSKNFPQNECNFNTSFDINTYTSAMSACAFV